MALYRREHQPVFIALSAKAPRAIGRAVCVRVWLLSLSGFALAVACGRAGYDPASVLADDRVPDAADACSDGVQGAAETDIDCGGACSGCELSRACAVASDCAANKCRDQMCAAPWMQHIALIPPFSSFDDEVGEQLAIDGDTLVVGIQNEDSDALGIDGDPENGLASNSGAVLVYQRRNGTWQHEAYLKAYRTASRLGSSVAIDGDVIAAGAWGEDAAYLFRRIPDGGDGRWISGGDAVVGGDTVPGDGFGTAVAVSGDTLVVGAPWHDNSAGAAYVFRRDEGGAWIQEACLKAQNAEAGDWFGTSVAVEGEYVVVGAPSENSASVTDANDNTAPQSGAAYVFRRQSDGEWQQVAYLKSSMPTARAQFGHAVALADGVIVASAWLEDGEGPDASALGASGAVYAFSNDDSAWQLEARLQDTQSPWSGLWYGWDLDLHSGVLAVGAYGHTATTLGVDGPITDWNATNGYGAILVYRRLARGQWVEEALVKPDAVGFEDFGFGVAVGDRRLVGGAPRASMVASSGGAAVVFEW